jgi:putative mycofactocin binding protein MftB
VTADTFDPATFDPASRYELDAQVALRPEPFGALAYHYGSRRLTFLRSKLLATVVEELGTYPSVDAALESSVPEPERPAYRRALAALAESRFIHAS